MCEKLKDVYIVVQGKLTEVYTRLVEAYWGLLGFKKAYPVQKKLTKVYQWDTGCKNKLIVV